jgi:glycerophosphoryl diester phosphodiesterase
MHAAVAMGAHGLELDVHRTADGHLVVAHDDTLRSMTGQDGKIRGSTLEELLHLDAAYNWLPGKIAADALKSGEHWELRGKAQLEPDLRIPTMEAVLEAFPNTPLNLELKARGAVDPLADLLKRHQRDDVIVVSFYDLRLRRFRRRAPNVPTATGGGKMVLFWLFSRVGLAMPLQQDVALQVPWCIWRKRFCDRRLVRAAHRRGLAVHVWTVDDPDVMHAAIDIGADGIMTDRPSVLAMVLRERPVGWDDGNSRA